MAAAEILAEAAQQVSAGRQAWSDPARPQGAFPGERPAEFGRRLDQDARGIDPVVLSAADLWASARSERQSRELKKPLPDASRRALMAVPEQFLERMTGDSEAQAVARLARQAERRPELSRWLAERAVAQEQPEPLQAALCWLRVSLQKRRAQLK